MGVIQMLGRIFIRLTRGKALLYPYSLYVIIFFLITSVPFFSFDVCYAIVGPMPTEVSHSQRPRPDLSLAELNWLRVHTHLSDAELFENIELVPFKVTSPSGLELTYTILRPKRDFVDFLLIEGSPEQEITRSVMVDTLAPLIRGDDFFLSGLRWGEWSARIGKTGADLFLYLFHYGHAYAPVLVTETQLLIAFYNSVENVERLVPLETAARTPLSHSLKILNFREFFRQKKLFQYFHLTPSTFVQNDGRIKEIYLSNDIKLGFYSSHDLEDRPYPMAHLRNARDLRSLPLAGDDVVLHEVGFQDFSAAISVDGSGKALSVTFKDYSGTSIRKTTISGISEGMVMPLIIDAYLNREALFYDDKTLRREATELVCEIQHFLIELQGHDVSPTSGPMVILRNLLAELAPLDQHWGARPLSLVSNSALRARLVRARHRVNEFMPTFSAFHISRRGMEQLREFGFPLVKSNGSLHQELLLQRLRSQLDHALLERFRALHPQGEITLLFLPPDPLGIPVHLYFESAGRTLKTIKFTVPYEGANLMKDFRLWRGAFYSAYETALNEESFSFTNLDAAPETTQKNTPPLAASSLRNCETYLSLI